jgi:hypothetical protein
MGQNAVGSGLKPCPANAKQAPPPTVTVKILAADGTSTPCTIVPVNGQIQLKGVPSSGSGTYKWSTTSAKISLMNSTSDTVTVVGGATPSGSRDAETIKLVYTPSGAAALAPVTIGATVVSALFSASANQSYGYDDMDGAAGVVNHVSVKKNDSTKVHLKLNGGITDADVQFASDDATIADAAPAGGGSDFEVTVNGKNQDKAETTIRVKCKCAAAPLLATILVDVYKEKAVTATIAKIYDSTVAATTLSRPNFDVKAAEAEINKWYKPAVAKITLTDNNSSGGATDIHFDLNGNGKLDLEPGGTSAEAAKITAAFNPTGQKVVIVRELAWIYNLKSAAAKDDTTITLKDSLSPYMKFLLVGNQYTLGAGATEETVKIKSMSGTTVTLDSKLTQAHPIADGLIYPLNGLSGNPIYVKEKNLSEAQVRQVIGHENGHSSMKWLDLEARNNLMHYTTQQRTDTKIRFKGQPRKYDSGNENQWDAVSR